MTTERQAGGGSVARRSAVVAALIIGAVIGVIAGSWIHYQSSLGGFASLGAGYGFLALAAVIGASALIALVAALVHRNGVALAFAVFAGALILGGVAGWSAGPTYRAPHGVKGTVTLVVSEPTAIEWSSPAKCRTIANGKAIASVHASPLTTLDGNDVWLTLGLGDEAETATELEIGQGENGPYQYRRYAATERTIALDERDPDRRGGTIHFADLALVEGPPLPLQALGAHLVGRLDWDCGIRNVEDE